MAEIENWSFGSQESPLAERKEPTKHPVAVSQTKPKRAWRRASAIAASSLLILGFGAFAYYYYIWRPPAGLPPPSVPDIVLGPTDNHDLSGKDVSEDAPSKPQAESPARGELARRFIQQYDGGDCFFIIPVAIGSSEAVLEGFGSSTTPFDQLDKLFKKSQGFEASIGVRLVTPAQCPAIAFLNKLRSDSSRTPRISLGSVKLRRGETLAGSIENFANRVVELLLVADDGQVQNISYALQPGTDALSFSLELPAGNGASGSSLPQLIMAVATPRVLDSLRQPQPLPADQFFLQAMSEAQRANLPINAAARYVTIQR